MDRRVNGAYLRDCGILYVNPSLPIPGTLADHAAEPLDVSVIANYDAGMLPPPVSLFASLDPRHSSIKADL